MDILSPTQCRAARAILNWSQPDLAGRCGMHVQTISNFEQENSTPTKRTLQKITETLEASGIEFIEQEGVRRKKSEVATYSGRDGFMAFMDDVYDNLKDKGGPIYILNVDERNWIKWMGQDGWEHHKKRMSAIKHKLDDRVIIKEGDYFFLANEFAEYRWLPKAIWNDQSFYAYGDRIGFFNFKEDSVDILVLQRKEFADSFRFLFNMAWEQIALIPDKKQAHL